MRAPLKRNASPGSAGASETVEIGKIELSEDDTSPRPNQDDAHAQASREKAEAQAERIRAYWRRQGVAIDVWVEAFHSVDRFEWCVRSSVKLCAEQRR